MTRFGKASSEYFTNGTILTESQWTGFIRSEKDWAPGLSQTPSKSRRHSPFILSAQKASWSTSLRLGRFCTIQTGNQAHSRSYTVCYALRQLDRRLRPRKVASPCIHKVIGSRADSDIRCGRSLFASYRARGVFDQNVIDDVVAAADIRNPAIPIIPCHIVLDRISISAYASVNA